VFWWSLGIAAVLGAILGEVPGALVGIAAVVAFDFQRNRGQIDNNEMEQAWGLEPNDATLFEVTFLMMGHIAKADGRVSEAEIATASAVMDELALSAEGRRWAVRLFEKGKRKDLPVERLIARLKTASIAKPAVIPTFLQRQLMVTYADGKPDPAQEKIIWALAAGLGVDAQQVQRLAEVAGSRVRSSRAVPAVNGHDPYAVLGLHPGVTDEDVRQAYRRLLSKYHPDKLVGKGATEAELSSAAERTRDVRRAYETVMSARGLSS
jgi:DnaJ like chaperone protein